MYVEQLADTPFNARLARGHKLRKGHELKAVQVSEDGTLWRYVYLCCGETIPDSVPTWDEFNPDIPKPKTAKPNEADALKQCTGATSVKVTHETRHLDGTLEVTSTEDA